MSTVEGISMEGFKKVESSENIDGKRDKKEYTN